MFTFTKEQINKISEQLDCGFRAFYHKKTGELVFVPDTNRFLDMDTDPWQEELDKLEENFLDYQEISAMESSDSFRVMADFTEQLTDRKLQDKLVNALNRNKPFREFKFVIDNEVEQRQSWFNFKEQRYIEWVLNQLKIQKEIQLGSNNTKQNS